MRQQQILPESISKCVERFSIKVRYLSIVLIFLFQETYSETSTQVS